MILSLISAYIFLKTPATFPSILQSGTIIGSIVLFSGCGKKEYIVFPFSASDVVKIETYYSNSEADTKEKTLTEEADIDYLYTFFSELPVKDANSDSTNDGSTIKFVFDLSDGTNYELVYIGIATKKGYLQSETSDFYYFTSSDIIGVWANLSKMRLDF